MHPKDLSIKDFSYQLPEERIARYPLEKRDESKLLVYDKGNISADIYRNIADHIPPGSLLVFNNSKVVEARLLFQKATGGWIEIFCLEPHEIYPDITAAMLSKGKVLWKCLVGGAGKWKQGLLEKEADVNGKKIRLLADKKEKEGETFSIEFSWQPEEISFAEVLHLFGIIPIPPYLERQTEESDKERYQTIYAKEDGSVAAPTAGLHFTEEVFASFNKKNISREFVTLHVGAGTFKPVKSETMQEHEMHAEFIEVDRSLIEKLINHNGQLIAVGTTSLRTLESLYWMGIKAREKSKQKSLQGIPVEDISVHQWDPYELQEEVSSKEALTYLLQWMDDNKTPKLITKTQVIIAPGYHAKLVNGLITNFHQPQSTLLLLVAALIGNDWRKVYQYAFDNDFRFLSYGDGSILLF